MLIRKLSILTGCLLMHGVHADNIFIDLITSFDAPGNIVTADKKDTAPGDFRIYESSTGLANNIEFLMSSDISFQSIGVPEFWSFSTDTVSRNGSTFSRLTASYGGTDSNISNEFYSFEKPWELQLEIIEIGAVEPVSSIGVNASISFFGFVSLGSDNIADLISFSIDENIDLETAFVPEPNIYTALFALGAIFFAIRKWACISLSCRR
ncbi:hypothetical protein [Rubellicoccus peritrichatus]|uniref:PEP-CTERM protein-sorting domain-containing protein n=1 Tax=Rubellicoccus peritrichatus TaxID=3080537 RepID=A0AAQ3LAS2_9BACT|nr:hypothetical protein [Puniceicoccus sp. CR14]WOO40078.1 hypothetical protein RZN69_15750 [Puniceicoccus sp. CR14]